LRNQEKEKRQKDKKKKMRIEMKKERKKGARTITEKLIFHYLSAAIENSDRVSKQNQVSVRERT
jgi:hypothetical protein